MENKECIKGIVYILSNETLPNVYKIGRCKIGGLKKRIRTLNTANPKPFRPVIAVEVDNMYKAEKALHTLYSKNKEGGEFYRFEPELIIPLLGLMGNDVTHGVETIVESELTVTQRAAAVTAEAEEQNKYKRLEGVEFHLRSPEAKMVIKNGKFVVVKGSYSKLDSAEHLQYGTYKRIFDKRNALVVDGIFAVEGDRFIVAQDIEFDNPSFAAAVVLGRSASRDVWLDADNKNFNKRLCAE